MAEELVTVTPAVHALAAWDGAAQRGLKAREEREAIIASVLIPGVDFGHIPGVEKPTLLKPGAEKIADSLNLAPHYELMRCIEDWDKPLFHYVYRCTLIHRVTGAVIATGIGSCNSMESKYRWREAKRTCPRCKQPTIYKGKDDKGGGWYCWAKRGGCGEKFLDGDIAVEGQKVGLVPNDDICTQVNTLDKMAQKRSLVAANLNLGFSHRFTQDVEDGADPDERPAPPPTAQAAASPAIVIPPGYTATVPSPPAPKPPYADGSLKPIAAEQAIPRGDAWEPPPPEDYTFQFGKYKGKKLEDVPSAYIEYLAGQKAAELAQGGLEPKKRTWAQRDKDRYDKELSRRAMIQDDPEPTQEEAQPFIDDNAPF